MSSTKDAPWSVMFEEIVKFSLNPSYIIELLSYVDNLLKLDTSLKC
jgi:predicted metallopeptidase